MALVKQSTLSALAVQKATIAHSKDKLPHQKSSWQDTMEVMKMVKKYLIPISAQSQHIALNNLEMPQPVPMANGHHPEDMRLLVTVSHVNEVTSVTSQICSLKIPSKYGSNKMLAIRLSHGICSSLLTSIITQTIFQHS